jgi:dihydroorotate dehydrogenase
MSIAKMMKSEFDLDQHSLSAIGVVETGGDAAEFILLGANTVQVGKNNCFAFCLSCSYCLNTFTCT